MSSSTPAQNASAILPAPAETAASVPRSAPPPSNPTSTLSTSCHFLQPAAFVLDILHQPKLLSSLLPATATPSPTDPSLFTVTDNQSLLFGLLKARVSYQARFETRDDGVDVMMEEGPSWTSERMRWSVTEADGEEDGCEVNLELESAPAWWTMGLVSGKKAEDVGDEMVEKLKELVRAEEEKKMGEQV